MFVLAPADDHGDGADGVRRRAVRARHRAIADLNIGLLFFLAMSSLGVYSVVLAGWSSDNKYSLLGSMRAAAQMLELRGLHGPVADGRRHAGWLVQPARASSKRSATVVLRPAIPRFVHVPDRRHRETRRLPFDLPEAESELVAGIHSEYSGMKFGMFFVGEYLGHHADLRDGRRRCFSVDGSGPVLPPIVWFSLKTFVFICGFILLRATLPRPRFDQLMAYGWKVMLPLALLNLVVTGAMVVARR